LLLVVDAILVIWQCARCGCKGSACCCDDYPFEGADIKLGAVLTSGECDIDSPGEVDNENPEEGFVIVQEIFLGQ
jgi:hypothetical protein